MAFEWKFEDPVSVVDLGSPADEVEAALIPVTEHMQPAPPPVAVHVVEIQDNVDNIDIPDITIDIHYDESLPAGQPPEALPEDTPAEDAPFTVVEHLPTFMGRDMQAFLAFIMKRITYPEPARRMHLEGRVFVSFVVDRDGSVTDIEIVRGIGGGCDEAVFNAVSDSPAWEPGKQRGVPVRVRMMLPVTFRLQ